jgi:predicted O-methyltransferase YrrM
LGGILNELKPKSVIEIGTYTGLSALTMKLFLPDNAKLTTFDIFPWTHFQDTALIPDDFKDGKLVQIVEDLCDFNVIEKYRELLESADLFFIDAAKDGKMEKIFIDHFKKLKFKNKPILIFDDIRLWNMLKIWREIDMPKMDLTSFGHWTGTGLVEWQSR